ncbi:MAG: hypothetical protein ACJAZ1_000507 [Yoonia sp.]|jgi:hypothetical protein
MGYPAAFLHCRCFCKDDAGTPYGETPQMHQMPIVHMLFMRGVLAHRRDNNTIACL